MKKTDENTLRKLTQKENRERIIKNITQEYKNSPLMAIGCIIWELAPEIIEAIKNPQKEDKKP